MRHVMIDLETMGTTPNSAIVSIGAVIFDPRFNKVTKETFYKRLAWKTQGRYLCPDTKKWWSQQSPETKKGLRGKVQLEDALEALSDFLPQDCKVWGNGAGFDIVMLEDAYRECLIDIPWKFWNVLDCRTVKAIFESKRGGLNDNFTGVAHNALDDAIHQAKWVTMMWNKLGLKK